MNHSQLLELINYRPSDAAVTRTVTRRYPPTMCAKKSVYYNIFLPKTVLETTAKLGSQ